MRGRSRSSRKRELSSLRRRSFKSAMDCFLFFTSPPARISYAAGMLACLWEEGEEEEVVDDSSCQCTSLESRSMSREARKSVVDGFTVGVVAVKVAGTSTCRASLSGTTN